MLTPSSKAAEREGANAPSPATSRPSAPACSSIPLLISGLRPVWSESQPAGLPQLTLPDALALSLLVRDRESHRYDRVAVRWLARFCDEEAGVELDEATLIAAHLAAFRAPAPLAAARSFAELLDARGRRQLAEAVRRWEIELAAHGQPGRAAR